jgi:Arc/MetJ-type ribon-helix-helix transcriptional regulator
MGEDVVKEKLRSLLARVRELAGETESRVEALFKEGKSSEAVKVLAEGLEKIAKEITETVKSLEASAGAQGGKGVGGEVEELRRRIEAELDELKRSIDRIASTYGGKTASKAVELGNVFSKTMKEALKFTARAAEDAWKNLEEGFREVTRVVYESVVVSARLPSKDIEVIDRLVQAGIFKSRSEAVAFFTRKGIEASSEWIKKALEKAERIKELKSSLRSEVEEYLKSSGS